MATASNEHSVDYLVIGGGLAGATAAEEIRKRDSQGSITIVTNDPELPYHRPPLSKEYLRGDIGPDGTYGAGGVYVQLPEWYQQQHVEVLLGVEATVLDTSGQAVRLSDGRILHYRMLLLAPGGRPRTLDIPGADLAGVHLLRSLANSNVIRAELATPGKRVVVVGSGFIGLETAASALQKGAHVTIVAPQSRIWPAMVSPAISDFFHEHFIRHGATIHFEQSATGFVAGPDGRLAAVRIAPTGASAPTREIPCDLAIVGVGIRLNTELAAAARLEVDPRHGIVTNERLETSVAGVFVAGDAVAYPDPLGGRMHFEHWDNAIASGQAAGVNMAGGDEPYRHIPYFFSDQFDLSLNMLGYPSSDAQIIIRGDMSASAFTALYVQNNVLRAALMVNDDAHMDLLRDLIAASAPVTGDPQRLANTSFDLSTLMPKG